MRFTFFAATILLCTATLAVAQPFPPVLSKAELEAGNSGFRLGAEPQPPFIGAAAVDVAIVSDLNDDGLDDLVVSTPVFDQGTGENAGRVYVIFGRTDPWPGFFDMGDLDGSNGFLIDGEELEDRLGAIVDSAGDFNGDGIGDLLLSATGTIVEDSPGKLYVLYGDAAIGSSGSFDLSTLDGSNGWTAVGESASDALGRSAAFAGDLNGDGMGDIAIAAPSDVFAEPDVPGSVYVIFGGTSVPNGTLDLALLDGTQGFEILGENLNDELGDSLSPAGDVNGDGFDDLFLGAFRYGSAGRSYVLFGGATLGSGGLIEIGKLDGINGFAIDPPIGASFHPSSLASAGDTDGDGFDDLLIGQSAFGLYEAYVVFGDALIGAGGLLDLESLGAGARVTFRGTTNTGLSVTGGEDVNGDGLSDFAIGNGFTASGTDIFAAGEGYVVFGSPDWRGVEDFDLQTLDGVNGHRVVGSEGEDRISAEISFGGDVNGDALPDSIWSLEEGIVNGRGGAVVVFGRVTPTSISLEIEPLVAGVSSSISIEDGPANSSVRVALSRFGFGTFEIPSLGVTLALDTPSIAAVVQTDGSGSGTAQFTPPSNATGRTLWFQAVVSGNVSGVTVTTVE